MLVKIIFGIANQWTFCLAGRLMTRQLQVVCHSIILRICIKNDLVGSGGTNVQECILFFLLCF